MTIDKNKISALIIAVFGVLAFIFIKNQNLVIISLFALVLGAGFLIKNIKSQGLGSGSSLFLIFLFLFHFGVLIPYSLFGTYYPDIYDFTEWYFGGPIVYAASLSLLGMVSFQAGVIFNNKSFKFYKSNQHQRSLSKLWLLLLVSFLLIYVFEGLRNDLFFTSRTAYLRMQDAGNSRVFGIARGLMITSGFIAAAYSNRKKSILISLVVLGALLPLFINGERGEFLVTGAAFFVLLYKKGYKFKFYEYGIGLIAIFFSIPLIKNLRIGKSEPLDFDYLSPIYEMGMQIRTVTYTVDAIQKNFTDWWYGHSYLEAFWRIIPNVGNIRGTLIGGLRENAPKQWLTDLYNPGGAGLGYSIIAEPYLNFGVFGVIGILFLLGYTINRFDNTDTSSSFSLSIYLIFLQSILWAVRNDFYVVIRQFVWGVLLLVLSIEVVKLLKRRNY